MQYQYSEEQSLFKDSLRKFTEDHYSYEARCALAESEQGFSNEHWNQLAELGVFGLNVPEAYDGFDGELALLCAVAEECGRALVLEPVLPTALLGADLLRLAKPELRERWLPEIASGSARFALAWEERASRGNPRHLHTRAKVSGDQALITGEKLAVLSGADADQLLVTAATSETTVGLFLIVLEAPGITVSRYALVSGERAATVTFDGALGRLVSADVAQELQNTLNRGLIFLGAQAMGAMDALMASTMEYCKTRKQFGLPIAAFQALQHRLADMVIACEKTRSLLWAAIQADAAGDSDKAAAVLKAQVGEAGRYVGQQAIQLHGGIGMTEELHVGAHFKLLTAIDALFGNRDYHLSRLSALALAQESARLAVPA